ncbi:MAG: nicotinamide riboside transporter PnuC [Bacteroidota bacterium]
MILLSDFFDLFYQNVLATTPLEVIAVIFGLLSVWYAKKANILVYPTGIVSVLIYVYICYIYQLYADMGINFFYFVMSVYGWYMWTRKDTYAKVRPIRWNTIRQQWMGVLATFVFFWVILGLIFYFKSDDHDYINSFIPYVDSFTTAIFLVGMLLMALKRIENWVYWIVGDVISIPLYFIKGLVFTSFQYAVFLAIAVAGYYAWKDIYQKENGMKV